MSSRVLAVSFVLACACGGAPAPPPTAAPPPAPTGRDTIAAADLRGHIERLASDELAGRETLQPGAALAADYLAERFAAFGLAPMPGQADFRVDYTLYELGYDRAGTAVALDLGGQRRTLAAGVDFAPFSFSDSGAAEAEVVFAGYGVSAPEVGHDDYAGLDVKGKIVLVLRYLPRDADPARPRFADNRHSLFASKARAAAERGAVGMLLVTGPSHTDAEDDLRLSGRLLVSPPEGDAAPARQEGPTFLAAHIARPVAEALLASTGRSLAEVERAADAGTGPRDLALAGARAAMAIARAAEPRVLTAHNVIAFLEGSDPALRHQQVVIGAHYDHLGAYPGEGDTVYNGADDNASGTAGLLELAQAFASRPERPRRSLLFVGFSGEEKGLLGSRALFAQERLRRDGIVFMLNLDMIGRNDGKPVEVVGDGYGTGLKDATVAANRGIDLPIAFGGADYAGNSDHHPFYLQDIPFMFFFTGLHDDYHQRTDHADKIGYAQAERIVRVAYGVVDQIASGAVTPAFVHHVTWLGIELRGATVMAVEPGSRAAAAGLAAGDEVVGFAGAPIADPAAAGSRFREVEPGTRVELAVRRGGAERTVAVERARTGYLGIVPGGLDDDARKKLGLAEDQGLTLAGLADDGPAGAAGLRAGDVLISIQGLPVGPRTLSRQLARIGAGEKVTAVVVRAGERVSIELTLGERPRRPRP